MSATTKFVQAVMDAQDAFWDSVATSYPEADSGDMSPEELGKFDRASVEAVQTWVRNNVKQGDKK